MKNRRLDIKLTDYELQQLEEEAMRRGMNKSELIRSLIARFPAPSDNKSRPPLR
jgi:predicted DNA binding CopG/RHH family protein